MRNNIPALFAPSGSLKSAATYFSINNRDLLDLLVSNGTLLRICDALWVDEELVDELRALVISGLVHLTKCSAFIPIINPLIISCFRYCNIYSSPSQLYILLADSEHQDIMIKIWRNNDPNRLFRSSNARKILRRVVVYSKGTQRKMLYSVIQLIEEQEFRNILLSLATAKWQLETVGSLNLPFSSSLF